MKSVYNSDNLAIRLIGEQNAAETIIYRPLKYLLFYNLSGKKYFVYNTMTTELCEVTFEENEVLQLSEISCENAEKYPDLIRHYYLVPKEFKEDNVSDQILSFARILQESNCNEKEYTILTTTDCNARCFYCFEKGVSKQYMSVATANDIAEYIKNDSKGKRVKLVWFGGEPLCNEKVIDIICDKLRDSRIMFYSRIVTNGFLLNNNNTKKAIKDWNLKSAQITLDGTEEIYNRCKAYINCTENAFERVNKNIMRLLDNDVSVNIRINLGIYNADDIYRLLDFIEQQYSDRRLLSVNIATLSENDSLSDKEKDLNRERIIENYIKLTDYKQSKQITNGRFLDRKVNTYHCGADNPNCKVISPNGEIGKCENNINEFYGSIYKGDVTAENINKWKIYEQSSEICQNCPIKPLCRELTNCPSRFRAVCNNSIQRKKIKDIETALENTVNKIINN